MPALQNTWFLALALVAISVKSSAVTSAYEVEGNIERQYVRPDGEWGTSTNWFQVSVSGCKSSIRTGGMSDKAVNYFEYVADGTNSALLISYNPAEEVSMAGEVDNGRVEMREVSKAVKPLNQASLTINSGVVPEYGFGLITPVWIATASSCFFQNSKSRQIEPIVSMGRGFREHSLKVLADWKLSSANPKLPEWMFDFADGKQYREEKSQLISENLAEPFNHPYTNLVYSVLSWTNLGDLHVPLEWKVVQYQPNFATGVVEPKIMDAGRTASLRKGTARSSFQIVASEYTRVVDRTLRAQGVPVREYAYITTNGDLLSALEITKRSGFAPILAEGRKEFPLPKRRSFTPVTVLVLLCVSTVIFLWWRRRRA